MGANGDARFQAPLPSNESDTQTLLAMPGFELPQPHKKTINNIITWVQCFSWYTAALVKHFPECTPGFMSHMFTVLKAYNEAEFPGWREYDHACHDKMASTGVRVWSGMDVALNQEHCSSRPKNRASAYSKCPGSGKSTHGESGQLVIAQSGCAEITMRGCAPGMSASFLTSVRYKAMVTQYMSARSR